MNAWTPPELRDEADRWREDLVRRGFSDDGQRLRGPVAWTHPAQGQIVAGIEVQPDERFPFAPPAVRVLNAGADLEFTFHVERAQAAGVPENLCLWDSDWPYERAPWRDIDQLLDKVRGWLERTAAGWPNDSDCDLERYLESEGLIVLYDSDTLAGQDGAFRTVASHEGKVIRLTSDRRRVRGPEAGRPPSRKDRNLAWVADVGSARRPLRTWADIRAALGAEGEMVSRLVYAGAVRYLLLQYQRGDSAARLAVHVTGGAGEIDVKSCESADTCLQTRQLRAGPLAGNLAMARVAVVGLGALGSFATDLLFRSGVCQLTLIDPERLRPGNLVRHLAEDEDVGLFKVVAVYNRLVATGLPAAGIALKPNMVSTVREAIELVSDHDVVLDATANARATSLLAVAGQSTGIGLGHAVISACVQRNGDVIRVDRFPLRPDETHLPALESTETELVRERGCGSPVSRTPPTSVVAAAELAVRYVIDQATRECGLPASMADVRQPQPEPLFGFRGYVTSEPVANPGSRA